MSILTLTISQVDSPTFDGGVESIKNIAASIDSVELSDVGSYDAVLSDADIKTSFKTFLSSKGYTWDSEA